VPGMNDDAAEAAALAHAIAESEADPREVPHAEVRAWLLQVAAGNFDAEPPTARILSAANEASEDSGYGTGASACQTRQADSMSQAQPLPDIDAAAETEALIRAVEEARKDRRYIPHSEMRLWLMRIEAGEFDAEMPKLRDP
jgi:hypothetical protein